MLPPDGRQAASESGDPGFQRRSVAATAGGITVLAWALLSAPLLLTIRTNEAGAIVALGVAYTFLPVAALVGLVELVLAWRGRLTALAVVAMAAGALGCVLAVPMLIGSLSDLSATQGEGQDTYGERMAMVGSSLAAVAAFQVIVASLLLSGRWRLVPVLAVAGALGVAWGPLLMPPPAASCPSVAAADLPGRIAMVGRGSGRGAYLPPGAICVAVPREGVSALVFAPSADDIAAEREWVNHPAFSPDGQRLAFTWERRVVVVRVDGSMLGDVGPADVMLQQPTWSPDGASLAVVADGHAVAIVLVAGGTIREVTDVEEPLNSNAFPRWSPTSDEILSAIAVPFPGSEDVVTLASDGSVTRLASGLQADWSPDGTRIAFVRRGPQVQSAPQAHRVMVMDADGGNVRELGGTPAHQEGPVWSPDGKWIAYAGFEQDWALYVQPASGGDAQRIATGLESISIDWAP